MVGLLMLGFVARQLQGEAIEILKITCLSWQGAYAPLTLSGELLVDGARRGRGWEVGVGALEGDLSVIWVYGDDGSFWKRDHPSTESRILWFTKFASKSRFQKVSYFARLPTLVQD